MTALRFVATTQNITVAAGAYLRVVPESVALRRSPSALPKDERPIIPPFDPCRGPDMSTGSDLLLNGKPARVIWADLSRAIVDVAGRTWLMSHMNPWEMAATSFLRPRVLRAGVDHPGRGEPGESEYGVIVRQPTCPANSCAMPNGRYLR